jgi:hypothetical protein
MKTNRSGAAIEGNRGQKVREFSQGHSGASVNMTVDTEGNTEGHEVIKPFSPRGEKPSLREEKHE